MNWLRIAKITLKVIVAIPAIIEAGKAGAGAGRAIVAAIGGRRSPENDENKPSEDQASTGAGNRSIVTL